ncbi:MAG: hypothetical protein K2P81_12940, partial [Bacteriovoracaceae bacterium]|nr:hypothetical protein [Bacteriovoracaceae bacterium]
ALSSRLGSTAARLTPAELMPEVVAKHTVSHIAAQPDDMAKMQRLAQWEVADKGQPTERRWRQDRAALALKLKDYKVIREEAAELAKSTDEAVAREWTYVGAKAALDAGEENVALETFKVLAQKTLNPDKWAVQSQHLSLDILNRQKNFAALAAQAALWTNVSGLKLSSHSQDVAQMESARQEALFEDAASKGETPAALALFMQYCQEGLFKEKSCPNAKVLAIKLHQQAELVKVLEIQNDQEALSSEYERMGRFVEAAKIQEKALKATDPEMNWFKVSLLYRIGGDETSRMRVLRTLASRMQKQGKMTEEVEAMSKATFLKSSMTPSELIRLPWSAATKIKLAAQFENEGRGDAITHKMVLSSKEDLGPVWAQDVITRVSSFDKKQRSVGFYGRNSRANFQLRLKLLAKFAEETKNVLPGASTQVRAYLLDQVAKAYSDIDKEILSSPVPEGLEAEQVAQVNEAMETLASPLRAEGESYLKLRDEQLSTLTDKEAWLNHIAQGPEAFMTALKEVTSQPETKTASGIAPEVRKSILDKLSQNPNDRSALESLRDDYAARGESAPAAYFTGRLAEMEKL